MIAAIIAQIGLGGFGEAAAAAVYLVAVLAVGIPIVGAAICWMVSFFYRQITLREIMLLTAYCGLIATCVRLAMW